MSTVFQKKLLNESPKKRVCFRLKEAREAKGLSLEQIVKKTKINKNYIIAIEECRFEELGCAGIYQKNFIKKYVQALGIDPENFLTQYCNEEMPEKNLDIILKKRNHLSNLPSLFRNFLIIGTCVCILFYLGTQIKNTTEPPPLTLTYPINGYITEDKIIRISGYTKPEITVTVNGKNITNDEFGTFKEDLTLSPGINTIIVSAKNKHGKKTEETRYVIYKETARFSLKNF